MIPENIRMCLQFSTSKAEYLSDPQRWDACIQEKLIKEAAYLLQKEHSETTITDHRAEKSIDLYVASPEVFWGIVSTEADKIAARFAGKI